MDIYALLHRLGVTANYTGFFQTALAVCLCMDQPERLLLVTKWVYPDVARRCKTNWKAVERNIRTVNGLVWEQSRPYLEELAGRELPHKPSNAQLLAILSYSLLSQRAGFLTQGEALASKGRASLAELQIGSNDEALPFIAVGNHLKEQFGSILVERDKANLVNDE